MEFGRKKWEDVRILGSWVSDRADVRIEIRTGG